MFYLVTILLIAAILLGFSVVRRLWRGDRLLSSVITGNFDESPMGRLFAVWFEERPARTEQRDQFVQLALAMKCPRGIVADRLMGCILHASGKDGEKFGELLAQQIDQLISFPPCKTKKQAQLKDEALTQLADFKSRLRSLDA